MKRFSEISEKLEAEGYRKTELTISITVASLITILAGIPLLILSIMLFHRINGIWGFSLGTGNTASFLILMLVLTVVHELLHGAAWSLFCENGWKDIEFRTGGGPIYDRPFFRESVCAVYGCSDDTRCRGRHHACDKTPQIQIREQRSAGLRSPDRSRKCGI